MRLTKAHTLPQAVAELRRLQTRRETDELPVLRRCPKFGDYVKEYCAYYGKVTDDKRPRTLATEKVHLQAWEAHLGETRLNHITPAMIRAFMVKRQGEGVSGRTVNLAIVVLRNVLKRGIEDGWLRRLCPVLKPARGGHAANPIRLRVARRHLTKTANCWGVSNNNKGTNTNRVVVMRKAC